MYKKAKAGLIVLLLMSLMYVAPVPRVFADVNVFDDDFNIESISIPKWSRCALAQTYDTVTFLEGNASVFVRQADNIDGTSAPIYHTLTGINTSEGNYNITGWAFTSGDHVLQGLDVGANKCDFVFTTLIGKRTFVSASNYSYITTGGGGNKITNIPLAANTWFQITQIIGPINATFDWIQGNINGTEIFNQTVTRITDITIQLHDAHGGTVGATGTNHDLINVTQLGSAATLEVTLDGASISNLEVCGDWVYAEEKFYNFTLITGAGNITQDIFLQLNDGVNNMTMLYNNTISKQTLIIGNDVINLGLVTASLDTTLNQLTVNFPIFFRNTVLDLQDANITARATDVNGIDTGWVLMQQNAFNIYNKGGYSQTVTSGTAGRVAGGDTFELFAQNNSWVFTNQTFRKIQQLSTQFGLRFTESGVGEDQFMQDAAHDGVGEKSSAKGDWTLEIAMNYCDPAKDVMVKGFYVILQMEDGDVGVNDQWINFNATWYDRDDTFIRSEIFNAWIELEPLAQTRLWLDLWFNKQNSSTLGGGRTTAYYFGMHKTSFMIFGGDWSPQIINATESLAFIDLLDNSSNIISSPQLDLMSISFNLTRPTTQNSTDWRLTLRDYDILEYKLRNNKEQMEGINTPTPNKPKVPDMPVTGFLAPLYAAITGIGTFVTNAITGLAGVAWGWIESQLPWFTGFIDAILASLGNLSEIFFVIFADMTNGFAFVAERIFLLAGPIRIVTDTWGVLVDNMAIFFAVNPAEVSLLVVILVGVIPMMDAVSRGDSSFLIRGLSLAWGVANTMIQFFIRLGQIVINIALEFWPF